MNRDDKVKESLNQAIFHYESEVKSGKEYAKPILKGLYMARAELKKYHEIKRAILPSPTNIWGNAPFDSL